MALPSIFRAPDALQKAIRQQTDTQFETTRKRKRKRNRQDVLPQSEARFEERLSSDRSLDVPTEYTAVVTPTERSQRRLAGLGLDREPPSHPFPHARDPGDDANKDRQLHEDVATPHSSTSLHSQHIAAMMAVLHRSMMAGEYFRAGRALGLLLRNEVGGQTIDIRKASLWGIGAEVLLRYNGGQKGLSSLKNDQPVVTREGFEPVKLYYERLIVQYPPHKTWPDAVNARDFCISLFGSWIYVTDKESLRMQNKVDDERSSSNLSTTTLLDAKEWELLQARQIADAMDLRMRDAPFNGERELIRLRAMVALWTADLLDKCAQLEEDDELIQRLHQPQEEDYLLDNVERVAVEAPPTKTSISHAAEVVTHRVLAESYLKRLQQP